MYKNPSKKRGFTLIELSIVLVVIGLVVGGVIVGADLIDGSKRLKLITQYNEFKMASKIFQDKYSALPGDITDATDFWGAADAAGGDGDGFGVDCYNVEGVGQTTCNGDGDGSLDEYWEWWRFWQHLSNAGLLEGSFSGVSGPGHSQVEAVPGFNVPEEEYRPNTGWTFTSLPDIGDTLYYAGHNKNSLVFGGYAATRLLTDKSLTPTDAQLIDNKIDDGDAATGSVVAGQTVCTVPPWNINATTATYRTEIDDLRCSLLFRGGFE